MTPDEREATILNILILERDIDIPDDKMDEAQKLCADTWLAWTHNKMDEFDRLSVEILKIYQSIKDGPTKKKETGLLF